MTDHYQTLGIARSADAEEIKRAYRRLASQHHPDKGGDKARFQEIQQAYDVLGDAAKRQQYDNPASQFNFGPGVNFNFNFDDMFGMFSQQNRAQQGRMIRMNLWITLGDVASGGRRLVSVATAQGNHTVEIDIPMGINDGDAVRYLSIGPGGEDMIIQFRIQPHKSWARQGLDLTTEHTVSVWQLILGGVIEFEDLTGARLQLSIPAQSQPGSLLRLRKKGLQDGRGQQGDLYVRLLARIDYPVPAKLQDTIAETVGK